MGFQDKHPKHFLLLLSFQSNLALTSALNENGEAGGDLLFDTSCKPSELFQLMQDVTYCLREDDDNTVYLTETAGLRDHYIIVLSH